jgi:alpha-L-fucosidase
MKTVTFILISLVLSISSFSNTNEIAESEEQKEQRMEWWINDRFGIFIHFGLYSLPAEHAWYKSKNFLTTEQYQKYFDHFNPDLFDPKDWAKTAKETGMKYMVITTKHHDGFCLWDSKYTDYDVSSTPFKRDIIREVTDAFRAEGIKVGLYYSLIDWHHPEYKTDHKHPQRNDKEYVEKDPLRDMQVYRDYMKNQITELLTEYGKIDLLWLDFSFPPQQGYAGKGRDDWNSLELLNLVKQLQPQIIINDRLDLMDVEGGWDFRTPEQFMPSEPVSYKGKFVPWETCQTLSERWTYVTDKHAEWKSERQLLEMLIETVSKNGNLILNAGPNGRGEIDPKSKMLLKSVGDWMHLHYRSIYNCGIAPEYITPPNGTLLTYNEKLHRLYIHLARYPYKELKIDGLGGKVLYAQFLNDASEVKIKSEKGAWMDNANKDNTSVTFQLPIQKPDVEIPVIEIFLKN